MGATGSRGPEGTQGITHRVKTLRSNEVPMQSFFTGNADAMLTTTNASTAVYTSAASILNN